MRLRIPRLAATLCSSVGLAALVSAVPSQELVIEREGEQNLLRLATGELVRRSSDPIQDERLVAAPDGRAQVALWTEGAAERPYYSIALDGERFARPRETQYDLHLKRARFDPLGALPSGAGTNASDALLASGNLYIVQYVCQPLESFDRALEQLGVGVHHFVPLHSRLVRMSPGLIERVQELEFVRAVTPYHAEYRIETEVLAELAAGDGPPARRYHVQVLEKGPALKEIVAARIDALGGTALPRIPDGYLLEAVLDANQLLAVAAQDEVVWIDRWSAPELDLNNVRSTGGANALENLTGFSGEGVRGEVCDSNVRTSHAAFQANPILLHTDNVGSSSHGTKTTGCVFSDGSGNSAGRATLPDGQPIFADYGQLGNRYSHTQELLQAPYFAVFQSNSWGGATTTSYTSTSMQMDDILFDMDITICQSQSNTGTQDSRPQAWAKNILSVGGIDHQNSASLADDDWEGIASIGPAADGRIKPDISFWAESILTTDDDSDTDYTTGFGGTSAATPCTAGYVGLIYQLWSEGVFGNVPSGATVFERRCKSTTARALLINSATQYGFNGAGHDLTRTHQGWGLPGVHTLYNRRDETFVVDESVVLRNLESASYALTVVPGQSSLKATMIYNDLPGTTSAGLHRINDLSLRATAPDGTVYWGNNGLRVGNWSTSGGTSNTIDVVENVFVQSPQAGLWSIEVFADEVNGDGHTETPEPDVDFALVVSGVQAEGICVGPSTYCEGKLTSILTVPQAGWIGIPSVLDNDFSITVDFGMPDQPSIVFWSAGASSQPMLGGTLCVQFPLIRGDVISLDATGAGTWPLDIADRTPGDREYFQVWMRDPGDMTGFSVGLSDGVDVEYCE